MKQPRLVSVDHADSHTQKTRVLHVNMNKEFEKFSKIENDSDLPVIIS